MSEETASASARVGGTRSPSLPTMRLHTSIFGSYGLLAMTTSPRSNHPNIRDNRSITTTSPLLSIVGSIDFPQHSVNPTTLFRKLSIAQKATTADTIDPRTIYHRFPSPLPPHTHARTQIRTESARVRLNRQPPFSRREALRTLLSSSLFTF